MSTHRKRGIVSGTALAVTVAIAVVVGIAFAPPEAVPIWGASALPSPTLPPLEAEIDAELVAPPAVPSPVARNHAARVRVELETVEVTKRLDHGVDYTFWTFGGQVPGNFIRVREGDLVELTLKNAEGSAAIHNIDLHAVTGPGGGAKATFTGAGESSTFEFRALNPGLYVYHCATPPVGMHVANGMYGLILVEPAEGMPSVDREFYVMQGEFYTEGSKGEPGHQPFSYEKALSENPDYVVFNGAVGSLMGERALRARTGDRVRLFFGNGGPSLVSSFHVIGEIFDNVYTEGGSVANHNVQTTLVPTGGATMVEMRVEVPGDYFLVDHAIFRAVDKGALGILSVEGASELDVFNDGVETR